MKRRRVSIATLCVAVAVVAMDCAWLRHVDRTKASLLGFWGSGYDAGALPMIGLLIVGAAHVLIDRGRLDRGPVAYLIGGLSGLALYLAYGQACRHLLGSGHGGLVFGSLSPIYRVGREVLRLDDQDVRNGYYFFSACAVYYTPPQLLVAAAVAALIRRGRQAPAPDATSEESR